MFPHSWHFRCRKEGIPCWARSHLPLYLMPAPSKQRDFPKFPPCAFPCSIFLFEEHIDCPTSFFNLVQFFFLWMTLLKAYSIKLYLFLGSGLVACSLLFLHLIFINSHSFEEDKLRKPPVLSPTLSEVS